VAVLRPTPDQGGKSRPHADLLDRLDGQGWPLSLRGARECLNPGKRHRSRRVPVTLLPSKRRLRHRATRDREQPDEDRNGESDGERRRLMPDGRAMGAFSMPASHLRYCR